MSDKARSDQLQEDTVVETEGHKTDTDATEIGEHQSSPEGNGVGAVWEEETVRLAADLHSAQLEQERLLLMYGRLKADFDNFRRRTQQEKETLKQTAAADLVKRLLPIVDNLERAVASAEVTEGPLSDGVRLVLRQFLQALEATGVQPIHGIGHLFDPQYHEAIDRVEGAGVDPGTIVDELQKGYRMGDVVLRPSIVRVAG